MRNRLRTASLLLLAGLVALAACSREEKATTAPASPPAASAPPSHATMPLKVDDLALGSSLAADKTVATATSEFAPTDTIYLSVRTSGTSPGAALGATWTYEDGQTVDEQTQQIAPSGPAVTEFHIAKPDGWPTGTYRVHVSLDGKEVGSKELMVR